MRNHLDSITLIQLQTLASETGDPTFLPELMQTFFASTETEIKNLHHHLVVRDAAQVVRAAHALKSSAGNLGALRMFDICQAVERDAHHRDLSRVEEFLSLLEQEFKALQTNLPVKLLANAKQG